MPCHAMPCHAPCQDLPALSVLVSETIMRVHDAVAAALEEMDQATQRKLVTDSCAGLCVRGASSACVLCVHACVRACMLCSV